MYVSVPFEWVYMVVQAPANHLQSVATQIEDWWAKILKCYFDEIAMVVVLKFLNDRI